LRTLTAPLVPVFTPLHRLVMVCPLASVMRTVQPFSAAVPLLRTVTSAWNPPLQLLATR
jgi:hypothetical protein